MKAILIDVQNEEIFEVEHDDTLASIYKLVDCGTFDVVRIDDVNSIYIDDEGLFVEDQQFFNYKGRRYLNPNYQGVNANSASKSFKNQGKPGQAGQSTQQGGGTVTNT